MSLGLNGCYYEVLFIEYQYARIFINSLGIQAIVERELLNVNPGTSGDEPRPIKLEDVDYDYIQEVISGACLTLESVTNRAMNDTLRFSTVRFYLRVTSASVFLLKALGLGARETQLQRSLDILERSIHCLKACTLDDMHLAPRYASLLDVHVARLRHQFIAHSKHNNLTPETSRALQSFQGQNYHSTENMTGQEQDQFGQNVNLDYPLQDMLAEDWLSLPFDPSMAPFSLTGSQMVPGLEEGALDFVWNLFLE